MSYFIKTPVSKSITAGEMQRMQDEGMKRKEIAKACGVCEATVSRYLGPSRKRRTKEEMAMENPRKNTVRAMSTLTPPSNTEMPRPRLLRQEKIELVGDGAIYTISLSDGSISAEGESMALVTDRSSLRRLIEELLEVERELTHAIR